MLDRLSSRRRAFTLVELLIVIVVIGILIAIVVPSFIGVRDNARDSASKSAVTVAYHNAKALWAQDEAFADEDDLITDLAAAEPGFVFQTATPTSGNPEHLYIDTDAIPDPVTSDVTICSESGSGTWFCLRADETGTEFVAGPVPTTEGMLAAEGAVVTRSWGNSLADAVCYLPTATTEAGDGCTGTGGEGWNPNGGASSSESEAEEEETPAPAVLINPAISGSAVEGVQLSTSDGLWANDPTSYTYQWQRAPHGSGTWTNISGATASTYTLTAGDIGLDIRVRVSASNDGGSATADASAVGPVGSGAPVSLLAPVASGTAQQGNVLSTTDGNWSNTPSSYAYQWQRSTDGGDTWTNISGATSATYTLTAGDVGYLVRARVTATNAFGSGSEQSAGAGPVASSAPANITAPVASGTAQQGSVLSTTNGAWSNSPSSYAYQWQRSTDGGDSWTNIAGATAATYTLTASDVGNHVRARVTATNAYGSASEFSNAITSILPLAPTADSVPVVSGTPTVGSTLTATTGAWNNNPTSYTYQWQRNSAGGFVNISGETASTYTVVAADAGWTVRVRVTATNAAGSATANSASVGPVPSAPVNTAAPTASGTAMAGNTLTASNGSWTGSPTSYTYQWQRSDDGVTGWTDISGQTSSTYTLAEGDLNKHIRVQVTAINANGSTIASSAARGPVDLTNPIVNGDFEGGSYSASSFTTPNSWTLVSSGGQNGLQTSPAGTSGATHLVMQGLSSSTNVLRSAAFTSYGGVLYWDVRTLTSTTCAISRVRIVDASNAPISGYDTGNTGMTTAWVSRSLSLAGLNGQTIKVEVRGYCNSTLGGGARFDNFRVLAS